MKSKQVIRILVWGMILGWILGAVAFTVSLERPYNDIMFVSGIALACGSAFSIFIIVVIKIIRKQEL